MYLLIFRRFCLKGTKPPDLLQKITKSCKVWVHMAETKTTKKTASKAPVKAKTAPVKAVKPKVVKDVIPADNGSFAVIETGGKQYRVAVGDSIKIEKIVTRDSKGGPMEVKEGDEVVFDKVLLIDNNGATDIGTPYIAGAKVSGTLVEIGRNATIMVIKYKQKSRYFKRNGHRQPFFKVLIEKIG
jgi:large subunit ribosomal protein L21